MRYMGGKSRQSTAISKVLGQYMDEDTIYVEPFCGALGSASRVVRENKPKKVILSDTCAPLIELWIRCYYTGTDWLPDGCDRETHERYRREYRLTDPLAAYYLFGFSYGGDFHGGFIDPKHAGHPKNGIARKMRWLHEGGSEVEFHWSSYQDLYIPDGSVVYCDPPYQDRKKHHDFDEEFNYREFWQWVRRLSTRCVCVTSCFECPDDFETVYSWGDTVVRPHNLKDEQNHNTGVERLVRWEGGLK